MLVIIPVQVAEQRLSDQGNTLRAIGAFLPRGLALEGLATQIPPARQLAQADVPTAQCIITECKSSQRSRKQLLVQFVKNKPRHMFPQQIDSAISILF